MAIQEITEVIQNSNNIVFFGGAGVSTESGIPDFRSAGGLYDADNVGQFTPEQILSHDFFMKYPEAFYRYYFRHMIHREAGPNLAHHALAELEQRGKLKAVITQNIDGLHQMAGSKRVLELHGSVHRNYCMKCRAFFDLEALMKQEREVPHCPCGGIIKPDVVLYQESLDMDVMNMSTNYIAEAEVLIVGGTSLQVYPAAGLIDYYRGDKLILINKTPTKYDSRADYVIAEPIGKVLQSLVRQAMN